MTHAPHRPEWAPRRALGALLLAAVAVRPLLDVLWWVDAPVPHANLPRAVSALLLGVFALATVLGGRRLRGVPAVPWVALWALLVVLALGRAPEVPAGLAVASRYLSGFLLFTAGVVTWDRRQGRAVPVAILVGAVVPVGLAVGSLGRASAWIVLHGLPRFLGPYAVLHAHTVAMGTFVGVGAAVAALDRGWRRALGAGVAGAAVIPLVATATRSGLLLATVLVCASLWVAGRRRAVLVAVGVAIAVVIGVPALRGRFAELAYAAMGRPPAEGWGWLGTGRVAIWGRSLVAFLALPLGDQLMGTGLGGYGGFWKAKEPHNDYLATLYQLGPLGLLASVGALTAALGGSWRRARRAVGDDDVRATCAVAFGMAAAVVVVGVVGSTFLVRLTVSWSFWALLAGAVVVSRKKTSDLASGGLTRSEEREGVDWHGDERPQEGVRSAR